MDSILLRYGEVGLKAEKKRRVMERCYIDAIADALKRNKIEGAKILNKGKRFVIEGPVDQMIEPLTRIPGIQSFSPAKKIVFKEKVDLIANVVAFAIPLVKGKEFRVEATRVGDHPFTSMDLHKEIGAALLSHAQKVNLSHPQVTIHLEIRHQECFLFTDTIEGLGGLPPHSSGDVLCMFSGGIDSPVAALQLLKRGCKVDFLHIDLVGDSAFADVAQVYNFLIDQYTFGYTPYLIRIDGTALVKTLRETVPDNLRQLALKLCFYKIAQSLAQKHKLMALATGEALSQKSTQTLESISLLDRQIELMVLRPLFLMDKREISKIAQTIGTFSRSERVKEYCNLSEGGVVTAPHEETLEKIPVLDQAIEQALSTARSYKGIIDIQESIHEVGRDAQVVDMRSAALQKIDPIEDAINMPFPLILNKLDSFESAKEYVIVCEFGVRSAEIATRLAGRKIRAQGMSIKAFGKMKRPVPAPTG
ncbi:MAG TPA: THUMP domain-containing protein [Candidatus Nanoarchaeia archaeon]|nr:THUMP domain-containing protein [Candidatus Nanoarchaeia archaeon]